MDNPVQHFGDRVRQQRVAQGMSQEELAEKAEISRTYLSQIEQGKASNLSLRLSQTLSTILGIEPPQAEKSKVQIPKSLEEYAKEANLPEEDVQMLARIAYRGKQADNTIQWRILYQMIKSTIGSDT